MYIEATRMIFTLNTKEQEDKEKWGKSNLLYLYELHGSIFRKRTKEMMTTSLEDRA